MSGQSSKDHATLAYALPVAAACMPALFLALAFFPEPVVGGARPVDIAPVQPEPLNLQIASWYGEPYHGRQTASGEIYDQDAMTAAHPTLPFGTLLHCSLGDRFVIVRVNDRGPFAGGRDLDLSRAAARQLGMLRAGVAIIEVREVQ